LSVASNLDQGRLRGLSRDGARSTPDHGPIEQTIEQTIKIEQREQIAMSWSDRLADRITALSGSMLFVGLHVLWFAGWIAANLGLSGLPAFDPFPFGLLTMVVSLEAIFLSTFVLISQNRQAMLADKRAKVDLQVDMLAEQEVTRLMNLVLDVHHHLGLSRPDDAEINAMRQPTDIEDVLDKMDEAERRASPESAKGPTSAADTES
jgi:uncharacterized membrane protein